MNADRVKLLASKIAAEWRYLLAGALAILLIISHNWASSMGRVAGLWAVIPPANLEDLEYLLKEVREEQADPEGYYRRFPSKYREVLAKMSARIESELDSGEHSPDEMATMRASLSGSREVEEVIRKAEEIMKGR